MTDPARILVVVDDVLTLKLLAKALSLAREAGIVYYASKPINLPRLRAVVAKAVEAGAAPVAP
jgi:CheY-like chemotaxis protein